jgi:SAM-dependent methyltransferase
LTYHLINDDTDFGVIIIAWLLSLDMVLETGTVSSRDKAPFEAKWLERYCPLCGPNNKSRIFADSNIDLQKLDAFAFASRKLPEYMHARLLLCEGCGILYGDPILSPDTLADAYRDADFDTNEEAHYASQTYGSRVERILSRLPDRHGALDIGTGDGAFLQTLLGLGFKGVTGIEPSEAPIRSSAPEIRPLIRKGIFEPDDLPASSFSLVTCFQTMEHVPDPLDLARGAYKLLKPGGAFAIVVHNRRAVSAHILGMKSPIFDLEHLQLFCPLTAKKLLGLAGFVDVTVSTFWNRYPLRYWARLLPMKEQHKRSLLGLLRDSRIGNIPVALPAGNIICMGFSRVN